MGALVLAQHQLVLFILGLLYSRKFSFVKYIFILIIYFYQAFVPYKFRGKCLFNESCSNYVLRMLKEKGLRSGLDALKFRMKNCKPGYYITDIKDQKIIVTKEGYVIENNDINYKILN